MKDISTHEGILDNIQRMPSSRNGNPRYRFTVGCIEACTSVDSSLGYSIRNYEGKHVRCRLGTHYGCTTIADVELTQ